MRWFWIDRFTEFVSGQRATAIKNVSRSEPHTTEYLPGFPIHPSSLLVEGLAQTAGLLVAEHNHFRERVVLAKISKAQFYYSGRPGDVLRYESTAEDIQRDGAICMCKASLGEETVADVDLVFAHLDDRFEGGLFEPSEFIRLLRLMDMYKVGVMPDGTPIRVPDHLLDAEQADANTNNES